MTSTARFATPEVAESTFYRAFEQGDISAMMEVWADTEEISCIHPGGTRLDGRTLITRGWEEIFALQPRLRFNISDELRSHDTARAIHLLKENISIDNELRGVVLATNIYRRIGDSWHMTLHHASPDPTYAEQPDILH